MKFTPGWNLLKSADDYKDYKQKIVAYWEVSIDFPDWGAEPLKYPAMAASILVAGVRVISAYFYVDEALLLLAADGWSIKHETKSTAGPAQSEFNKHSAAIYLSLLQVMIDKGLITKAAFETKHQSNLAVVDRWEAEDKRESIRDLVTGGSEILDKLLP